MPNRIASQESLIIDTSLMHEFSYKRIPQHTLEHGEMISVNSWQHSSKLEELGNTSEFFVKYKLAS